MTNQIDDLLESKFEILATTHRAVTQKNEDFSTLDKLEQTDALTALRNRRFLITDLELHITEAHKKIEPISFVMVDIDNFKQYNDSFGHRFGDEVLKFVARLLEISVRYGETVGRYGGGEFGVILPGTNALESKRAAERWRKIIEEFKCPYQRVTVSLGCATLFPTPGQSVDINEARGLIGMADQALYVSKRTGKNKVTQYDEIRNQTVKMDRISELG
jgi:diguanylate cyclase (GGDEF)-like protein